MNNVKILDLLKRLGLAVNKRCCDVLFDNPGDLHHVEKLSAADIIYKIDLEAEEVIVKILNEEAENFGGIELIAEGIGKHDLSYYPEGCSKPSLKIICDPIDGSRGLMYGKRAAFFLAAAGPSTATTLADLPMAVMVELPVPKQQQFDILHAITGQGTHFARCHLNGRFSDIALAAATEKSIEGGFMSLARFCYPGKDLIGRVEEKFLDHIFHLRQERFLPVFDDQYISTGGQLYELIAGRDRFTADFRAAMYEQFVLQGKKRGQVCHPYDMAGLLIAREAGIIVTDLFGKPFNCSLTTKEEISWLGYANKAIRRQCEKPFLNILRDELGC